MTKEKDYGRTRFDSRILSGAFDALKKVAGKNLRFASLKVRLADETWRYDTVEEFFAGQHQRDFR